MSKNPPTRHWNLPSVLCAGLLAAAIAPLPAHAQVSPVGAHHATQGSGAGLNPGVSPVGTYSAQVPLDLPSPRGDVPVPLSVVYTGTSEVGDGGAGWTVPLSYVRVSTTISRRRPMGPWIDGFLPPERVFLALDGAPTLMFPSDEPGLYRPFVADSYLDLRRQGAGWVARDAAGRSYTFSPVTSLGAGVADDTLWLLTEVRDLARRDRVKLSYRVEDDACRPGWPEVMLSHISYTFDSSGFLPLYQVSLVPRSWGESPAGCPAMLGINFDEGHRYGRRHIIDRIEIRARDNASQQSQLELLRSYQLSYSPDADSGMPRLDAVDVTGGSGGPTLPVARYRYGAATSLEGGARRLRFGPEAAVPRPGPDVLPLDTLSTLSSSRSQVWPLPGNPWPETITARHLIRDFTGNGLPDLLWQDGSKTYMVPNVTDWDGTSLADVSQLVEFPSNLHLSYETIETSGEGMSIHRSWVQAIDWNGDGRLDILDAIGGKDKLHWRLLINRPGATPKEIDWLEMHVDISSLREQAQSYLTDYATTNRLPLSLSLTMPDATYRECRRWERLPTHGWRDDWTDCDSELEHRGTDTATAWTLADINGDSYPDFVINSEPLYGVETECEFEGPGANDGVMVGDKIVYVEECEEETRLAMEPGNRLQVFFNRAGAVLPTGGSGSEAVFDQVARDLSLPDASCGVEWWRVGGAHDGYAVREGDSFLRCGFEDINGDGIADYHGPTGGHLGDGTGGFQPWFSSNVRPTFATDRHEVCTPETYNTLTYITRQTRGLVDVTGDGIPDLIEYNGNGLWRVRPGTGVGFGQAIPISADAGFELSMSKGMCGQDAGLVAGILDVNGDGRPEAVRVAPQSGFVALRAASIHGSDGRHAWSAGKLVAIENGYGAVERIQYTSAKNDTRSVHQVPFPEIVVAQTRVDVDSGAGTPLAPTLYAYGGASLRYDGLLSRWVFAGYQRQIQMAGARAMDRRNAEGIEGIVVVQDAIPSTPGVLGYEGYVMSGRPRDVHRLEGWFEPDPWLLIDIEASTHGQLRGQATTEYGASVTQSTSFLDQDGCFEFDPYGPTFGGDPLCQRQGVVYGRKHRSWEGVNPLTSKHVKSGSTVLQADEHGRPLMVALEGDLNTSADDRCLVVKYAEPTGGAPPGATVVHGIWLMSHCTGDREFRTMLSGVRHEYDHLSEGAGPGTLPEHRTTGRFADGLVTRQIVERYDAQTGELLDEHVSFEVFYQGNPFRLPGRIVRTRQRGSAATRMVESEYDAFGVSRVSTTESASDVAAPLSRTSSVSVYPWVPSVVTEPNGEASVTYHDPLGRPLRSAVRVDGQEHVLVERTYDDSPGGRAITVRSYADFDATEASESTTHLDALGRVRFTQHLLGADYGGQTLVSDRAVYDELGRVVFAADPFESAQIPFSPASSTEPTYGTSYWYQAGGKLRGTVRGPGHLPLMPYTIEGSSEYPGGVYPTLYSYDYSAYRAVVSRQGPSERTVGSPQFGARDQWRYDGGGRLVYEARLAADSERIELATYGYDRLDHRVLVRRFRAPGNGSLPLDWTMAYDSQGQLLRVTEPGTSTRHHEHDEWGGVIESSWTDGGRLRISRNQFDGFGRSIDSSLVSRLVGSTSETTEWRARYFYDAHSGEQDHIDGTHLLGRLSHVQVDGVLEAFYGYDGLGRTRAVSRVSATDPSARRFTVRYDHAVGGALRQIEYDLPGIQEAVSYEYDSAERISRVVFDDGAGSWPVFDATEIDDLGRYRAVLLGNGVVEEYDYDELGRRALRHHAVVASGERTDRYFDRFDGDGRLLEERQRVLQSSDGRSLPPPVRHLTHTYDASKRLGRSRRMTELAGIFSTTRDERFSHDALGNVTELRDATSGSSLLLSFSSSDRDRVHETMACNGDSSQTLCRTGYGYDGAGNVTRLVQSTPFSSFPWLPTRPVTTELEYDAGSRVVRVSKDNREADVVYGAFGELAELTVSGWGMQQRRERRYGDLVREAYFPAVGEHLIERTIPGPQGVIAAVRGTGDEATLVYHHGDAAANRLFTGDDGQVVQRLDYDAFGLVLEDTGTEGAIDYTYRQWNFGESLEEFGIVLVGARVYHPETGRFLQRDPLMLDVGASRANPYSFAFSDPVNFSDPTGLAPWWSCSAPEQCSNQGSWARVPSSGAAWFGINVHSLYRAARDYQKHRRSRVDRWADRSFNGIMAADRWLHDANMAAGQAAIDTGVNLYHMATSPRKTVKGLILAVMNPGQTIEVVFAAGEQLVKDLASGDPNAFGRAGFEILTAFGPGAFTKVNKLETVANLGGAVRSGSGFVHPSQVRFTQDSVSASFKAGGRIDELAAALRAPGGDALAGSIPPIRLVEYQGALYTLDNRRLAAFAAAGRAVPYRMATTAEIATEWAHKFTTTAERGWGWLISVRRGR